MNYNITDFGAKNGEECTKAIQNAIDKCASMGGGRVEIPCGMYISGSVWLKSNVELHLQHGAVLKASDDIDAYNDDEAYPQNWGCAVEQWRGKHLIIAHECDNVAVTGTGVIDGSGDAFFGDDLQRCAAKYYGWENGFYTAKDKEKLRPGQLVCFIECTNVNITDVTALNSPCWCFYFHGCEYVRVHGIKVKNPIYFVNTDGIDIDCCRYVTVSDCIILTGDDAIAIRCDSKRLKNPKPCEHVVITNCVLSSEACAVRIGVGVGEIKYIRASNITVLKAGMFLSYMTSYSGHGEAKISNVAFDNISVEKANKAISFDAERGSIRNVSLHNMSINTRDGISIVGCNGSIDSVELKDIYLNMLESILNDKTVIDVENAQNIVLHSINVHDSEKNREKILCTGNKANVSVNQCDF